MHPRANPAPVTTTALEAPALRKGAANDRAGARDGWNRGGNDRNRDWRNRNGNDGQAGRNRNHDRDNQAGNGERRRHHDGNGNHNWHHDWDRNHHHRDWWRSHYTSFVLFGGGYYYWNAGFWYPAYGYDPYYSTYAYDAPIYGYNSESPAELTSSVQAELARLGYYFGAIDGTYGPLTRSALLRYQRSVGIAETGLLDEATLQGLGID